MLKPIFKDKKGLTLSAGGHGGVLHGVPHDGTLLGVPEHLGCKTTQVSSGNLGEEGATEGLHCS